MKFFALIAAASAIKITQDDSSHKAETLLEDASHWLQDEESKVKAAEGTPKSMDEDPFGALPAYMKDAATFLEQEADKIEEKKA